MGLSSSKQNNVLSRQGQAYQGYALVTGSTSGIGRDLAHEVCKRGLSVIVHGRDPERLDLLAQELRRQYPGCDVRALVLDAASAFDATSGEMTEAARSSILAVASTVNLKLLINNVGIGHNPAKDFIGFAAQTPAQIMQLIHVNITFMTLLTHLLLPTLQMNAKEDDPGFVVNSGSLAELGLPWIAVYSGAKAYVTGFSKALDSELRGDGKHVHVIAALIGDTDSDGHKVGESLFTPSSGRMARMILDSAAGAGAVVRVPYWGHWVQLWLCRIQPYRLLQAGMIMNVTGLRDKNGLVSKKQI